jgi:hypothetical protein
MNRRAHLRLLGIATATWVGFWLLGLPSYYRQYSAAAMGVFSIVLLPPIVAIAYVMLRRLPRSRRTGAAAWTAFYFSVPLALYDWLYCGVYLACGLKFVAIFWYLTVFYVVPWVVLPAMAILLNRRQRALP